MPKIPHPDDVPKFIRGTVTSAFQNLNTLNPTTSTRTQPDSPKAEAPPRGRKAKKKGKPKYSQEQQAGHRAETNEGRVRRDVFDARNMPLEGQPAVERHIVPEEASTGGEAPSIGEAHAHPAALESPSPPTPVASPALVEQVEPEDSADSSKREDSPALAAPPAPPHRLGRDENADFRQNKDTPARFPHITSHAPTHAAESSQHPQDEPRAGCLGHAGPTRKRLSPRRSLFERAFLPAAADIEAVGGEWVDVRQEEGEEGWEKVFREYEDEE